MNTLFEILYWIRIWLSPVFVAGLVIAILSSVWFFSAWYLLLLIPAVLLGTYLAERARRKYGTANYIAKTMNTLDIKETWEKEAKDVTNEE